MENEITQQDIKRKRGHYFTYDDQTCGKKAKYASTNGNKLVVDKLFQELGHPKSDNSVWNMKKVYLEKLKTEPDPAKIVSLPYASRGHPLMVGEFDSEIDSYIRSIHSAGECFYRDSRSQGNLSTFQAQFVT